MSGASRIAQRFAELGRAGRAGLVTYLTCGDPDGPTFARLLAGLPGAGADFIEVGMPFSDPMADGPTIQAASLRALQAGMSLKATLALVAQFRQGDGTTPIILMGYYNPIYQFGIEHFLGEAKAAGVDGLIIVDLPPEHDEELCQPALAAGIDFVRLTTPTTDDRRLPVVLATASGFIYHVAIAGITGTRSAAAPEVAKAVAQLKRHSALPVAVGFGIRTPEQAAAIARVADAAVVGSALVETLASELEPSGRPRPGLVPAVLGQVRVLAEGLRAARNPLEAKAR